MTRDQAVKPIRAFFHANGQQGQGLNQNGIGGILFSVKRGAAQIFFEFDAKQKVLNCSAHLATFDREPTAAELEGFKREEEAGTETGGGRFEYMPPNRGLFLTRTYPRVVDDEAFIADMNRLADASMYWRQEVLYRVLERARAKAPSPQRR